MFNASLVDAEEAQPLDESNSRFAPYVRGIIDGFSNEECPYEENSVKAWLWDCGNKIPEVEEEEEEE